MPALQAVFLYEVHHYDVAFDDMRKWTNLPYAEAAPHLRRATERARGLSQREGDSSIAGLLLPAMGNVFAAQVRVDRKVAALRCVEALRLHAAANAGKLPPKLAEVVAVPIPSDPFTGKSFEYRLEGNKATLTGPPPTGELANLGNSIRYELTMRPAKEK
jgi:hypothetical protein